MSTKTYDPRKLGAKCDICPLGPEGCLRSENEPWSPVPPKRNPDNRASVIAIAESPGPEEVSQQTPLVGRSGTEWDRNLFSIGYRRHNVDLDNVISCKPPGQAGGAWSRMDATLSRLNKKRAANGEEPIPHPAACCRPRLLHEAGHYDNILTLGGNAAQALSRRPENVQAIRGDLMLVDAEWNYVGSGRDALEREDLQGVPLRKVVPTLHPAFVLRAPAWRPVVLSDLSKAFRFFRGTLRWVEPDILWRPSADELHEWLQHPAPFWTYDVETNYCDDPEVDSILYCLSIGTPDMHADYSLARPDLGETPAINARAVGITLLYRATGERHYDPQEEDRIRFVLHHFFTMDTYLKVGSNVGYFDTLVSTRHFSVRPSPVYDTLFPSRFAAPDIPKGLKVRGTMLTDVDRWDTNEKGEKHTAGSDDDDGLLKYNCIDVTVNARIVGPLDDQAAAAGAFNPLPEWAKPVSWPSARPWTLSTLDHARQEMCVELHHLGVWVNQKTRGGLETRYRKSTAERLKRLQEMHPKGEKFNPGSAPQVRDLLYEDWGLWCPRGMKDETFLTETGLPGTGDEVLRAHLADSTLDDAQKLMLYELRLYRREATKILGTTLLPMQLRELAPKKGIVPPDGRVHATWNSHVTAVGRLSCSGPNLQNIGNRKGQGLLKTIFEAAPGHILLGADLDQAHLKITANYWNIERLRKCFLDGWDPHNMLAYDNFGELFSNADGWTEAGGFSLKAKPGKGSKALATRNMIKTFRYASIYEAVVATVHGVIQETELEVDPEEGERVLRERGADAYIRLGLPYLKYDRTKVEALNRVWHENEPDWRQAWKQMEYLFQQQGYMREPVFQRQSGCLSDGKVNEVVNYPVLAAEASLMAVAELRIRERWPVEFAGIGTGLIHQCHDSVAVEVPLPSGLPPDWKPRKMKPGETWADVLPPELEEQRAYLERCMTIEVPSWDIPMTAEAGVGRTLADV